MLHRALATLLCLLGAAAIGLGIASATLWRASDTLLATAEAAPGTTLLMTDPGVLDLAADEVTVRAAAEEGQTVVVAVGRTSDVEAWVGIDPVTRVTGLSDLETLSTEEGLVERVPAPTDEEEPAGEETAPAEEAPAEEAPAEESAAGVLAPDPAGSDLWVLERTGSGEATLEWPDQEGRWSVLVAATGEDAAPPSVSLAWPQEVTTPWLVPGVAVGSALLLAGALWWALLLVRARRTPSAAVAAAPHPAARSGAAPAGSLTSGPGAPPATPGSPGTGARPEEASDVAAAPLTRRQLREAEQQRERERRERDAVRSRFPIRVAGPVRDDAAGPAAAVSSPPSASAGPTSPAAPAPAAPASGAPAPGVPGPVAAPRTHPQASASTPAPATDDGPQADSDARPWSSRLTGRLPSRGRRAPATPPPAPEPTPEPTPTVAPGPAPAAPSASADAWRKAWGFPSGAGGAGAASAWPPGAGTDTSETEEGPQR